MYSAFRIVLQVVNGGKRSGSFLIKGKKKENNAFINDPVLEYNKTPV